MHVEILHRGVLGLSLIKTEFPHKIAGIIWLMADKIGKSKDAKIKTVPSW